MAARRRHTPTGARDGSTHHADADIEAAERFADRTLEAYRGQDNLRFVIRDAFLQGWHESADHHWLRENGGA